MTGDRLQVSVNAGANEDSQQAIRSHRDLIVWQKSMDLVDRAYEIADRFPQREKFGLWSQMTRAATSVPSNIAEGHARSTRRDFASSLSNARASLMEVDTQLAIAGRRKYVTQSDASAAYSPMEEISKMLVSLQSKLAPRNDR